MAVHGAQAPQAAGAGTGRSDDEDAVEKKKLRMLKRKLPSLKDRWKDAKCVTFHVHVDMNTMFQRLFDILFKLRGMVRDQVVVAPDATNVSERAYGVKRATLPDQEDYAEKRETMSVCQALELGMN